MNKEILHFTADWCGPCQQSKPIVEKYLEANPSVIYTKIDIDRDKDLMEKYKDLNIMSIPAFVGLYDGVINRGHSGVPTNEYLDSLFDCGLANINCD